MGNTGALIIELPPQPQQTEFNLRRWSELLRDPELAKIEGRVETDRYGHVIMSPPPAPRHGFYQAKVAALLQELKQGGGVLTGCPISTADGVRAADVAWASAERVQELGDSVCFSRAPEICVEVLSPGNSDAEIREKTALYFDAGAKEVWHCSVAGAMTFLAAGNIEPMPASRLCPSFPAHIHLR
ncbi:MAG: Uma2 family endonuclease [Opitutaceae bacterium]